MGFYDLQTNITVSNYLLIYISAIIQNVRLDREQGGYIGRKILPLLYARHDSWLLLYILKLYRFKINIFIQ